MNKIHPYLKKMIDYSNDIINGEIVACQKHIWSCQRFLNDLKRSEENEPDFPYIFVPEKAELFEKWCSLFKHTKGVLTGKPIVLAPIQCFIFGNIYGWYHKDTGYRRFTKSYWQVGRKNAKTQSHACVGLYEEFVFSGKEQAEVYAAATKKSQAEITYNEAVTMLNQCELFESGKHYSVKYGKIIRLENNGIMRALSKDDKRGGDGLNPSCGLVDEYHEHPTAEIKNILTSGMGSRPQPLSSIITTAGFELNNPCYRVEYQLISKILDPDNPTNVETYFVMVNELEVNTLSEEIEIDGRKIAPGELIDNIKDESVWLKANPIQCSYDEGIAYVRNELEIALASPEEMTNFLTKIMNVWVNARAFGYMDMSKWAACQVSEQIFNNLLHENTDKTCYVGFDLSAKLDLTSVTFEFVGNDDKYYFHSHSFMPSEMFHQKLKKDQVPYDLWEKMGWLTVTEGSVVDYRAVKKWVLDTVEQNGWLIEEVCIDPWGATALSSEFADEGITVVEIRQGFPTLTEPTKDVKYMVYGKRAVYAENHLLSWAVGNCVTRTNHNECMMLDKEKAKQRIDPVASLINAHVRAMCVEEEPQNRVMFI